MSFTKTPWTSFPDGDGKSTKSGVNSLYNSATFGNTLSLRVDEGVGSMTISPSGRDVALASKSGLYIIDLDDPFSPPRWLHHVTSWEVADVQWSPHAAKPSWVISTSNQKALLWNLALSSDQAIEHILHGHKRAITDINFHGYQPEMIATCSVDSYVHVWDMRDPRKLVQSFADWTAGATQVKWNRMNPHLLASAHDRKVYIWDSRKGSIPLHTLNGHGAKVNGLDFNRENESKILTCSNDRTVKLWDYEENNQKAQFTIETDFPVWRARHTPFGQACIIMPLRGGNNNVYMNDMKDARGTVKMSPLHAFSGHSEPVKEFVWRVRGGNDDIEDREFQLVTWSKDHDLKLWPLKENVLEKAHYNKGSKLRQRITRRGCPYISFQSEPSGSTNNVIHKPRYTSLYGHSPETKRGKFDNIFMTGGTSAKPTRSSNAHLHWISGVRIGKSAFVAPFDDTTTAADEDAAYQVEATPRNLGEEVSIVGHRFPKVRFEKISVSTGECIVSLNGPWGETETELVFLRVDLKFPQNYPYAPPRFKIEEDANHDAEKISSILDGLCNLAGRFSERGKYCLEPCLRFLLGDKVDIEDYVSDEEFIGREETPSADSMDDLNDLSNEFDYSSSDDELIDSNHFGVPAFDSTPVPKGCGGMWSKSGELVCFFTQLKDKHKLSTGQLSHGKGLLGTISGLKGLDTSDAESSDSLSEDSDAEYYDSIGGMPSKNWTFEPHNHRAFLKHQFKAKTATSNTERSATATVKLDKGKNVVTIHDFSHLIPSRKSLASEYKVIGDEPEVLAGHNAEVAKQWGAYDVSDCWKLLQLLLAKDVSFDWSAYSNLQNLGNFTGGFAWGNHPFGKRWMVAQIFRHFEQQNNTQMLATMSCVMSGRTVQLNRTPEHQKIGPRIGSGAKLSGNSGESNRDSYHSGLTPQYASTPGSNPIPVAKRASSIDIPTISRSQTSNYNIEPSSASSRDSSVMSLSPEKFMNAKKAVAGIFTRANHTNVPQPLKISRWNSMSKPPWDEVATPNFYGPHDATPQIASRNSFVGGESVDLGVSDIPKVQVEVVNEHLIDWGENLMTNNDEPSNLLEEEDEERYRQYRWQYAAMLYSWGLEIKSLELVKFNFNLGYYGPKTALYEVHSAGIGYRGESARTDQESLDIETFGQTCHYCQLRVKTRFIQCPKCEHVLHSRCAEDWWAANNGQECVSGCGCSCLDYV